MFWQIIGDMMVIESEKFFSSKESAVEEVKKIIGEDSFYWCKIDSDFDSPCQWQDNKTEATHILEIEEFELE